MNAFHITFGMSVSPEPRLEFEDVVHEVLDDELLGVALVPISHEGHSQLHVVVFVSEVAHEVVDGSLHLVQPRTHAHRHVHHERYIHRLCRRGRIGGVWERAKKLGKVYLNH